MYPGELALHTLFPAGFPQDSQTPVANLPGTGAACHVWLDEIPESIRPGCVRLVRLLRQRRKRFHATDVARAFALFLPTGRGLVLRRVRFGYQSRPQPDPPQ